MELHHLRSFAAVARHGRLAAAARILHLSQPAVSAHLKELEAELGQPLFTRSHAGMAPTAAARELLPRAEAALAAVDGLRIPAVAGLRGDLDVGTIADAAWVRAPQLLAWIRARHPGLNLRFHQSISGRVQHEIAAGRLHAGWSVGPVADPALTSRVLAPVRLRVAGPAAWRARLAAADRAGLAAMPWVATPPECPYTRFVADLLAPLVPERPLQADMESSLRGMAEAGHALTLLRADSAEAAERAGALALWPGEVPPSELRFIIPAGQTPDARGAVLMEAAVAVWSRPESDRPSGPAP